MRAQIDLSGRQFAHSIVITDRKHDQIPESNAQVVVDADPQIVFYKLSQWLHPAPASSGIHETAIVHPEAVIGPGVEIGAYSVIGKVTVGENSRVDAHVVIYDGSIIGKNVVIESNTSIGATGMAWIWDEIGKRIVQPQTGGVSIEDDCLLGTNITIVRGSVNELTTIGKGTTMAHGTMIGHGAQIGPLAHFANNVSIAGNVRSGEGCFFGSGAVVRPQITLGGDIIVGAGAVVTKNFTETGLVLAGVPATILKRRDKGGLSGVPNSR